ncbi:MAG: hypothetical protein KCHDKBKB_01746 [Elusimicrobia bacterium]|nr:hypothetical protein [Elusimicrobiota bacterium]
MQNERLSTNRVYAFRICPSCEKENPRSAYCCLYCFNEMTPKIKIHWWQTSFRIKGPVGIIVIGILLLGVYKVKHFVDVVEAQVNMNFDGSMVQSPRYDSSLKNPRIKMNK